MLERKVSALVLPLQRFLSYCRKQYGGRGGEFLWRVYAVLY